MEAAIIGAPLDLGAGRRGVDMGPSAIRYAGLEARLDALGYDCFDWGNVGTAVAEATTEGDPRARFLNEIKEACKHVAHRVAEAVRTGVVPVVLGGDHSVALGTLGGLASVRGAGGDRRARRPQHAGDFAKRKRARHATRGGPRCCR